MATLRHDTAADDLAFEMHFALERGEIERGRLLLRASQKAHWDAIREAPVTITRAEVLSPHAGER